MSSGFASVLSEGQPAQLDLGEEVVRCLVVGFTGPDVVLAPGSELPRGGARARQPHAYLLIEAERPPARAQGATSATARAETAMLVPRCSIPSGSASAALFSRAPLVLPAHLRPAGDAGRPVDHVHARHQRRRPARRPPVSLPRGRRARGRDRARAGRPRDPGAGRDRPRDRHRRLAQLHRDRGRGPAAARPADVRVSPPPRRSYVSCSANAMHMVRPSSRREETHGWFCPGLSDRQRRCSRAPRSNRACCWSTSCATRSGSPARTSAATRPTAARAPSTSTARR